MIRQVSLSFYGCTPKRIKRFPSSQNPVFSITLPNGDEKVIKLALHSTTAIRREQRVIECISRSKIPARTVRIEGTQSLKSKIDGAFTLMPKIQGETLIQICSAKSSAPEELLFDIGKLVGRLAHALPSDLLSEEVLEKDKSTRYHPLREVIQDSQYDLEIEKRKRDWEALADTFFVRPMGAFTHGDFHGYQIVVDSSSEYHVLDWENARLGRWQHDMGSMLASIGIFGGHYQKAQRALLNGLRSVLTPKDDFIEEVRFWVLTFSLAWITQRRKQKKFGEIEPIRNFLLRMDDRL